MEDLLKKYTFSFQERKLLDNIKCKKNKNKNLEVAEKARYFKL